MSKTAATMSKTARSCTCQFTGRADHDRLTQIQTDPAVLAEMITAILDFDPDDTRVHPVDYAQFIHEHNWPDPPAAALLALNLADIFRAVRQPDLRGAEAAIDRLR